MVLVVGQDPSQKKPKEPSSDVVLIHGVTEDGRGLQVLRAREERIEAGQVRPLEHGKAVQGDIVKLRPRPEAPFICDVETELKTAEVPPPKDIQVSAPRESARKGPAQVASAAYRQNWDAIWSATKRPKNDLPN
jgi:hypothetical protein